MPEWLPERLPEDIDAERSFLATCCAPGAGQRCSETVYGVDEGVFVHPAHLALFKALKRVLEANLEVNSLTLKDDLDRHDELGKVGGYPGLIEILSGEDVERPWILGQVLTRKWKQRRLVHLGAQLVREASEETDDPEILVDRAAGGLEALVQTTQAGNLEDLDSSGDEWLAAFEDQLEGRVPSGLHVGFDRLDRITRGFKDGHLIVLAARPGIGKTALALNWLLRVGRAGKVGAFFSLEMPMSEIKGRLVADQAGLDLREVLESRDRDAFLRVARAHQELQQLHLSLSDRAGITAREIIAQCRRLKAKKQRLDFVVIDYLQLISSPDGSKNKNEAIRVGEITRALKVFAKDDHVPVVLLSQLNREVEHRTNGRPQLSDLRDSGAIEQDADIVAFLHRKMTPEAEEEAADKYAELLIAKHRGGKLAVIPMYFEGPLTRYRELDRETAPSPILQKPGRKA